MVEPCQVGALFPFASVLLLRQGAGRGLGPYFKLAPLSQSWIPGMRACMPAL